MIEYRINLLRGRVPTSAHRRRRYWLMVGYLGVAGVALVAALSMSTGRLLETNRLRGKSAALETQFRAMRGDVVSITEHAALQQSQLQEKRRALESVAAHYAADPFIAPLLQALVLKLPAGALVRHVAIQGEEKTISFEILFVGAQSARNVAPADLLARWNEDSLLAAHVSGLAFLGSRVEGIVSREDTIWRFSASLKRGGT